MNYISVNGPDEDLNKRKERDLLLFIVLFKSDPILLVRIRTARHYLCHAVKATTQFINIFTLE